jgi:signal transduction histidine kinase
LAASLSLGAWVLLAGAPRAAAAEPVRINGTGTGLALMTPLLQAYAASHPADRVRIDAPLGTSGAMLAILSGALDLAVVSRAVTPEEAARGARAREYGRTPLLVVTHQGVAKRNITTAELEEIYSGKTASWPGGEAIRVTLRPRERLNHAQKMEAVGSLAGGVAHDFNNILTVILSFAGALAAELKDEQRKNALEIERAGRRAAALTRQLLSFSRKQVLHPEVLKVDEVVANVARMPGMGGVALGRAVRARRPVPVLFMSGYSEEIASGKEAIPPEQLLEEPFDRTVLLERVAAALASRRLRVVA